MIREGRIGHEGREAGKSREMELVVQDEDEVMQEVRLVADDTLLVRLLVLS